MSYLYNKTLPELNEIVIVKVIEINKLNVITSLIDYNNLVGYISYSELSKKKRFNVNKIVSLNKEIITSITGINKEANYYELSVRVINAKDIENFTENRKKYLSLYNLWRYIYLKLNFNLEMNINNINNVELYNFMINTLWKIKDNYEDKEDKEDEDDETILNNLLNPNENFNLLKLINHDANSIKTILDNYILLKTTVVKAFKTLEFKLNTYEINGCDDIKKSLEFKMYNFYNDIIEDYDVEINYLSNSVYRLSIKQKDVVLQNSLNEIETVYNKLVDEIKLKCSLCNINFII